MAQTSLVDPASAAMVSLVGDAPAASASIVSRALLQTPEARVTWFSFAAGQELTSHTNARRALIQIVSGACDFFYNDDWHRLGAGAWLHLPPSHPHAVRAVEPFTMLLTLCPPATDSNS